MIANWINRLFGGAATAEASAPAPAVRPAAAAPAPASGKPLSAAELNADFYHWLNGETTEVPPATVEKVITEELGRLLQTPSTAASMVPRVPAVIPQLLRSLREDSTSGADLARQIGQDVVLVAEVVREANSPYYAPTAPVKNIEGAVMLLGQNGLRLLLARVAFRPVISQQTGRFAKLAAPNIWTQSEKCALAAGMLAVSSGQPQFEAYLSGLMENVGLMVAFRLIDQIYDAEALPQSDDFCRRLSAYARMLSGRIARLWDLPPDVITA
ncbi:MAG TPA: HDOD domain-containing protein, partial [Telluria sp.]|nr:HDOD domain-containing protein [Telluria sp.]